MLFFLLNLFPVQAQSYDPAAGSAGSLAVSFDDPSIRGWATRIVNLNRGLKNCSDSALGEVSSGRPENALGPALSGGIISLGDGGSIVLGFPAPVSDGAGIDFAVFENGFSDGFLELATVEVSSNGSDYVQFPPFSETQNSVQTGPFDTLDARNIYNLAGKYRAGFGTGFDLSELSGNPLLDIHSVRFIRIRDVVGSLNPSYGTKDALGRFINDPWPTAFESGGFDLDAVGVMHFSDKNLPLVWPSIIPSGADFSVLFPDSSRNYMLSSAKGEILLRFSSENKQPLRLPENIRSGIYLIRSLETGSSVKLLVE